jgi:type IV secretory pathway TrbD component
MSLNRHVPLSLIRIMMSALLLGMVLLVFTCWFHNTVTLLLWLVSTILALAHTRVPCLILPSISLHMVK